MLRCDSETVLQKNKLYTLEKMRGLLSINIFISHL